MSWKNTSLKNLILKLDIKLSYSALFYKILFICLETAETHVKIFIKKFLSLAHIKAFLWSDSMEKWVPVQSGDQTPSLRVNAKDRTQVKLLSGKSVNHWPNQTANYKIFKWHYQSEALRHKRAELVSREKLRSILSTYSFFNQLYKIGIDWEKVRLEICMKGEISIIIFCL